MSFNTIPAFSMSDIQDRDAQTIAALKLEIGRASCRERV